MPAHSNLPGFRTLFSDRFVFFPFAVRGISPGIQRTFYKKYKDYAEAGWDVLSAVRLAFVPGVPSCGRSS